MASGTPRPAVFLDRDNTLIEDPGYLSDPDQVKLLDETAEGVARLRQAGYPVIVVTNQSGVARGYLTEEQLTSIHQRMQDLLQARGTGVDAVYYCPYLDGPDAVEEAYRLDSELRKPKPGMLLLAAKEMDLDLSASWMIGDSERDIQAGRAAGCTTILLSSGDEGAEGTSVRADFSAPGFSAAVDLILTQTQTAATGQAPKAAANRSGTAPQLAARPAPQSVDSDSEAVGEGAAPHRGVPGSPTAHQGRNTAQTVSSPQTANADVPAQSDPSGRPPPLGNRGELERIIEELRMIRRGQEHDDFSIGKLAGAIAQAFALCAVGWGLYAWTTGSADTATIGLLAGIAFQLMALTFSATASRK
ncbi:MAG: HAD-IIIA family hydrolase [Phycisphaerae bacterium]|nr:HAD-IIIA family hydrolase [Phycisphaerae bacterium]